MISRRSFLGSTTAWGVATAWAAKGPAALGQARSGCGMAMGTYGLQSLGLAEAIQLIAETGFQALEITAMPGTTGDPALLATADRKRIRGVIADSGLRLTGIMAHLEPKPLEADHQAQLAQLYHLIQLGHHLSPDQTPVVQTVLGGKNWDESRQLFRDRIANWVQVCGDQKGFLSIKPHRQHAMNFPSQANWIIEQLGAPERLGMTFDYSHYALSDPPISVETAVEVSLPHTNYIAVKDAVKEGDKIRFLLPGEGDAWDHAEVISAFYDGGYRGDFCCEVSSQVWKAEGYDPVAATRRCHEALKGAFDRAGVAVR